jgi:hypothetical protein
MAGRKDGCARPHYAEEQIASLQKELGLRLYENDCCKCLGCGNKVLPDSIKLQK